MKLGIDLGTTNSAMARYTEDQQAEVVENEEGSLTTPSAVILEEDGSVTVGRRALRKRMLNPDRTFTRTKQDMGTENTYEVDSTEYRPERIAGYVLEKLVTDAENRTGEEVESAVITVPYYFGDKARRATKNAAGFADLGVEEVINEPTAACIAYQHDNDVDGTLLVFDLGGGTFDATLVEMRASRLDVVATEGDQNLGGENFDDALYEHVRQEYIVGDGHPDPNDNESKRASLRREVKEAKHDLTPRPETTFAFDTGDSMVEVNLTREEFDQVTGHLVERTVENVRELFEHEKVDESPEDVDHVLMVGGSTRIPHVQERVEEFFGMEPLVDANPDTIVARGAAMQSGFYDDDVEVAQLPVVENVLSHSLGVQTSDGRMDPIFEKNDEVPDTKEEVYSNPQDDVRNIVVRILQGEAEMAADCETLGEFTLEGITPQPAGEARIEVEFEVAHDGTLTAEAVERDSGTEGSISIEENIGLSDEELEEHEEDTAVFHPEKD